jgi:Fe2+ or Zn2+ uptake regulation protein
VKSSQQLIERFRSQHLKVTPQRQCIFEALSATAGSHPTAESIWATVVQTMPAVSLKTVYQTLNDLASMGVLTHLDVGTGSARFDINTDRHHHLVCTRCANVWDVYVDLTDNWIESRLAGQLPDELNGRFFVSSTDIVFRGLCETCRRAEHSSNDAGRRVNS